MAKYNIVVMDHIGCPGAPAVHIPYTINDAEELRQLTFDNFENALRQFYKIVGWLLINKRYDLYAHLATLYACDCVCYFEDIFAMRKSIKPEERYIERNTPQVEIRNVSYTKTNNIITCNLEFHNVNERIIDIEYGIINKDNYSLIIAKYPQFFISEIHEIDIKTTRIRFILPEIMNISEKTELYIVNTINGNYTKIIINLRKLDNTVILPPEEF